MLFRSGAFHHAFVVVDEEPRGDEVGLKLLLQAIELDRAGDRIAGATAELALIVDNFRTLRPQIDFRRELRQIGRRRGIEMVAMIGSVGKPPVPFDLVPGQLHGSLPYTVPAVPFIGGTLPVRAQLLLPCDAL